MYHYNPRHLKTSSQLSRNMLQKASIGMVLHKRVGVLTILIIQNVFVICTVNWLKKKQNNVDKVGKLFAIQMSLLFFQVFSSCTHCSSREADMRQRGQSYGNLAMMTIYNCTKNTSGHSKFICLCDILVTSQVTVVHLKGYIFSYILV